VVLRDFGMRGVLMFPTSFPACLQAFSKHSTAVIITLFSGNLFFNILANSSFKYSSASPTWRSFLVWQIIGNLAGLITVLTLTGLLHYLPLSLVFPVTTGLAIIGVQVVSSRILFGETITTNQWLELY